MTDHLALEIQKAIASGDFQAALPLIEAYGNALRFAFHAAPDRNEKLQMLAKASGVLQDRLHLARVMRAQLATQSLEATRYLSYAGTGVTETWHLEA